jgi:hypothetical protein
VTTNEDALDRQLERTITGARVLDDLCKPKALQTRWPDRKTKVS